jgi:hypothetical protein
MRRVRVTIVAVEKQEILHILSVCSLSYPECQAHEPYYMSFVACLDHIFLRYLINGVICWGGGGSYWTQNGQYWSNVHALSTACLFCFGRIYGYTRTGCTVFFFLLLHCITL